MKVYIGLRSRQRGMLPPSPDKVIDAPSLQHALFIAVMWLDKLPLDQMREVTLTVSRTDEQT